MVPLEEIHSGEYLYKVLLKTLLSYNIENYITRLVLFYLLLYLLFKLIIKFSITRDNSYNITSLVKRFRNRENTLDSILKTADIRCLAYIINLLVNNFLKSLSIEY